MPSLCPNGGAIEQRNGVLPDVGTEVRVAHGHLDRRVPQELLHRLERREEQAQLRVVGAGAQVVEAGVGVALLAGEPVGLVGGGLEIAAVRIERGFADDGVVLVGFEDDAAEVVLES